MSFEIVNYYDRIKKDKNAVDTSYPNEKVMNISLPARMLFVAPSGAGKTNLVRNIIDGIGVWDKIVLWAKDLEEPLYHDLIEKCRKVEKKYKVDMLLAITNAKDLPSVDDFNPKEHNLLILDDLITEDKKSLEKLDPFFVRGRKKNITMMFLSQGYYNVPKLIRKNCQYIVLKQIKNAMDRKRIMREFSADKTPAQLEAMYQYAMTKRGDPHTSFFMFDGQTKDDALKYRANLDPIPDNFASKATVEEAPAAPADGVSFDEVSFDPNGKRPLKPALIAIKNQLLQMYPELSETYFKGITSSTKASDLFAAIKIVYAEL